MHIVYDAETFPNLFSVAMTPLAIDDDREWVYEISDRRCDGLHLAYDLRNGSITRMLGFNNLSFDYPLLHHLIWALDAGFTGAALAFVLFNKAQEIIASPEQWSHRVRPWEVLVEQVDLMLIHHFDNRAKMTSLKVIEFNMQSPSVEDMPFPVGTWLAPEQIDVVLSYNRNDTRETKRFAHKSMDAITFREQLIERGWFGAEVMNYNDTKIGKEYFKLRLEKVAPGVTKTVNGRKPQTHRAQIHLAECIFPYVQFDRPELRDMLERLKCISFRGTETKSAYKEVVNLDGFTFDIGQGGIHGSVTNRALASDAGHCIVDIDVTGYYPSLAIVNRLYPEHLGPVFCDVYRDIRDAREKAKADGLKVEAGTLKLSTNGTFGDFGNVHSVFYDPKCLIGVTINGQLLQVMLVEQLMRIPTLEMVQMNTDGLTVRVHRAWLDALDAACDWWQRVTCLKLERKAFAAFWCRDVNNYIAKEELPSQAVRPGWEKHKGAMKRKGDYDWEMLSGSTGGQLAWNRDFSGLVIPKAAEAALVDDVDPAWFIEHHSEPYDFMMRARVTGGSKLQLGDGTPLPKTVRYFVSTDGKPLVKIMPPLKGQPTERRIGIHAEGQAECTGDRKNGYRCSACSEGFVTKAMFEVHNKEVHAWGVTTRNVWNPADPQALVGLCKKFYVQRTETLLF
jgi:hypothetical protein